MENETELLPMDLQFFAEEPDTSEDNPDSKPNDAGNDGEDPEKETENKSGKTFTRDDIAKMIAAEKDKWQKEHESEIEEAKSEGAKLAKMSAKEREEAEKKKKLDDLEAREQKLNRRELEIATKSELVNSHLPESFLEIVIGKDAETTNSNIKKVKDLFDEEVGKAVTERLKTPLPKNGASASGDSITARIQQNLSKIK